MSSRALPEGETPDSAHARAPELAPEELQAFGRALQVLNSTGIPYALSGAFAKYAYTGAWRNTKDLDVFLLPAALRSALDALAAAGYTTSIEYEHWLAKAHFDGYVVDLIFGLGHGRIRFTRSWFERARPVTIAGLQTRLLPIEELVVSKCYVAERYRFDGADILHLIQRSEGRIDWQRVLALLGPHRELLLWYLIMFDFVYPGHSQFLPQALMAQLFAEARARWNGPDEDATAFRGTLLDPFSFLVDTEDWGYQDRRNLEPLVDEEGDVR